MSCSPRILVLVIVCLGLIPLHAAGQQAAPTIWIPHVSRPPTLEDFLNRSPREAEAEVTGFRQFEPGDGAPVSEKTTAYLSYDDRNLYVIFVCKDEPGQVRARLSKREDISSDDTVVLNLDTFHDRIHAYRFITNPLGIQLDGIFTEGQGPDDSFDTLWHSAGRLTEDGYIVWMAIPFKSLRFPRQSVQDWGIALGRSIARKGEFSTWPYITQRLQSYVQQLATLRGLEQVSPGRNLQFIPYFVSSQARFLAEFAPGGPAYRTNTEARPGLDAKLVLRDALTLDVALNPDFSQVESDEPQVTVNQRYEVFFPEKRPFFIENAGYFQTPSVTAGAASGINLFFSRRIIDPQIGSRLTGKIGRWAVGALAIDDRAEGKLLPASDTLHDVRARIEAVRVQREFQQQSSVGVLITNRNFSSSWNRVFSVDTRLKLNPNWILTGQAVKSQTKQVDGSHADGTGYWLELSQSGRHAQYAARYLDYSPFFQTQLGFVPRVDLRKMEHYFEYYWKPKSGRVLLFGPDITTSVDWNHSGQLQDWLVDASFGGNLAGPTGLGCRHVNAYERFEGVGFRHHMTDCGITTEWLKWLALTLDYGAGTAVNYYPGTGLMPFLANTSTAKAGFTFRPSPRLRLDETYLYTQLAGRPIQTALPTSSIFNNHVLRSKLNYQFSRALSLRLILDYNAVLPNSALVSLERTKRLMADVLLTYMLNPGTALYVGYTDTYENAHLVSGALQRGGAPDVSTGRQLFVKVSYMLRF